MITKNFVNLISIFHSMYRLVRYSKSFLDCGSSYEILSQFKLRWAQTKETQLSTGN